MKGLLSAFIALLIGGTIATAGLTPQPSAVQGTDVTTQNATTQNPPTADTGGKSDIQKAAPISDTSAVSPVPSQTTHHSVTNPGEDGTEGIGGGGDE